MWYVVWCGMVWCSVCVVWCGAFVHKQQCKMGNDLLPGEDEGLRLTNWAYKRIIRKATAVILVACIFTGRIEDESFILPQY